MNAEIISRVESKEGRLVCAVLACWSRRGIFVNATARPPRALEIAIAHAPTALRACYHHAQRVAVRCNVRSAQIDTSFASGRAPADPTGSRPSWRAGGGARSYEPVRLGTTPPSRTRSPDRRTVQTLPLPRWQRPALNVPRLPKSYRTFGPRLQTPLASGSRGTRIFSCRVSIRVRCISVGSQPAEGTLQRWNALEWWIGQREGPRAPVRWARSDAMERYRRETLERSKSCRSVGAQAPGDASQRVRDPERALTCSRRSC